MRHKKERRVVVKKTLMAALGVMAVLLLAFLYVSHKVEVAQEKQTRFPNVVTPVPMFTFPPIETEDPEAYLLDSVIMEKEEAVKVTKKGNEVTAKTKKPFPTKEPVRKTEKTQKHNLAAKSERGTGRQGVGCVEGSPVLPSPSNASCTDSQNRQMIVRPTSESLPEKVSEKKKKQKNPAKERATKVPEPEDDGGEDFGYLYE